MIKLCGSPEQLGSFGVRIRSDLLCYPDALCWQLDSGVLARRGGSFTLYLERESECDVTELREFIAFQGGGRVCCNEAAAQRLRGRALQRAVIMCREGGSSPDPRFCAPPFPEYQRLYRLFDDCGLAMPDYECFLSDLSQRRLAGRLCIAVNEQYTAAAISGYEDGSAAIASAVAVDPLQRRQQLGRAALDTLGAKFERLYIYREPTQNREFYESLGFRDDGMLYILEL